MQRDPSYTALIPMSHRVSYQHSYNYPMFADIANRIIITRSRIFDFNNHPECINTVRIRGSRVGATGEKIIHLACNEERGNSWIRS